MTDRHDLFAAAALTGFLARPGEWDHIRSLAGNGLGTKEGAILGLKKEAVAIADIMVGSEQDDEAIRNESQKVWEQRQDRMAHFYGARK